MRQVFADSFYFLARFNRRDQHHERATQLILSSDTCLVTTEWILLEVADGLASSNVRPKIRDFVEILRRSSLSEVVPLSSDQFAKALVLYHQSHDKAWTLTDCTSFLVMRDRQIKEALTGDHHFEQAGFVALLK